MRNLYKKSEANYPRLKTDVFFADYENTYKYDGFMEKSMKFIESFQLLNPTLWNRFVEQFSGFGADDSDAGWRGEYWGKMMRGACFVYSYTKNSELYEILSKTVADMISCAEDDGRISSYSREKEFDGWDIWSRKYVLLGMQYFLEICDDKDFSQKIVKSMCAQVDYMIERLGDGENQKPITSATRHWRGLNSSSVLEPVVRLYNITGDKKYFDFATYIVNIGGTDVENIFDLAFENKLYPYQYPVTKAYEMTSCFEGLLEYYRITGEEKYKTSIINFANKVLESDFTIIGCCGCTHELFDHSTVRQANTDNGKIQQETCVTVTLMKFFYQLTLITGNSKYVDAFETSLYNAYLGSVNTEKVIEPTIKKDYPDLSIEPLPFDSYSPLTAGTRGNGIGGFKVMRDNHYYGCCACIGAAGIGIAAKMQLLSTENGFAMNLYINGTVLSKTPMGETVLFETKTEYPKNGAITVELKLEKEEKFELRFRNPAFSETTKIVAPGTEMKKENGYIYLTKTWKSGDKIEINLDMRTKAIYPISYGSQVLMNKVIWGKNYMVPAFDSEDPIAKNHIALRRGPIILAQDNRLGYSVDEPVAIKIDENGYANVELCDHCAPFEAIVKAKVELENGKKMLLTDYSSAGKLWSEESKMAAWILTK